jgi:RHS repeat-associated protein
VLQERDASNAVIREYTWGANRGGGIGGLLNLRAAGQDYNYLYDGKGNVSAVIDSAQTVVASYRYDTFGRLMVKSGTLEQPFQFSTKRYFADLGLNYYGYRFYAPAIGRWMRRDPLGVAGGINLYGFVQNNPVNWVDPMGLTSPEEIATQIGAVGPFDANTANNLANDALQEAQKSGLPGLHNGSGDAFRHCYWSCRMTQDIGEDQAEDVGNIHEACGNNPPGETAMDLNNNKVGRSLGKPGVDCKKECMNQVTSGGLQTSPGGTPPTKIY